MSKCFETLDKKLKELWDYGIIPFYTINNDIVKIKLHQHYMQHYNNFCNLLSILINYITNNITFLFYEDTSNSNLILHLENENIYLYSNTLTKVIPYFVDSDILSDYRILIRCNYSNMRYITCNDGILKYHSYIIPENIYISIITKRIDFDIDNLLNLLHHPNFIINLPSDHPCFNLYNTISEDELSIINKIINKCNDI